MFGDLHCGFRARDEKVLTEGFAAHSCAWYDTVIETEYTTRLYPTLADPLAYS